MLIKKMENLLEESNAVDIFIGKRLRDQRLKLNLTLTEVAEKVGLSHQQIQKYEQAKSRIPVATLYQLSQVFGVTSHYFFDGLQLVGKDYLKLKDKDTISQARSSTLNIFIVEDDPADELLTRRAFKDCKHKLNIFAVHDGSKALEFLRDKNAVLTFPRPDIILLDLNIPKRDGHSVLKEIKRDREIQDIPVIILTNSVSVQEMISVYKNHASGYICKSFDFDVFQQSMMGLINYWASVVVLPQTA